MIEEISRRIKEDFRDDRKLLWHNLKNWKKKKRRKNTKTLLTKKGNVDLATINTLSAMVFSDPLPSPQWRFVTSFKTVKAI